MQYKGESPAKAKQKDTEYRMTFYRARMEA